MLGALVAVALLLVGCDNGHAHVRIVLDGSDTGDIEGFAYFPYEDASGDYPVYYDTGNELILVTLYEAGDIYYEFPLRDYVTGTTGYFAFWNVEADWYYLTAETQEYDSVLDVTNYYWAETPDFELDEYDILVWELFLELEESVPGLSASASAFDKVCLRGDGELPAQPELDLFHELRLDRFREQDRQRPSDLPPENAPE